MSQQATQVTGAALLTPLVRSRRLEPEVAARLVALVEAGRDAAGFVNPSEP